MSGKSWVLPQSASEYNMGTGVPVGVTGPGGRWVAGSVPASASLYSMASGSSSISGWSKLIDEILSSFVHVLINSIRRSVFRFFLEFVLCE